MHICAYAIITDICNICKRYSNLHDCNTFLPAVSPKLRYCYTWQVIFKTYSTKNVSDSKWIDGNKNNYKKWLKRLVAQKCLSVISIVIMFTSETWMSFKRKQSVSFIKAFSVCFCQCQKSLRSFGDTLLALQKSYQLYCQIWFVFWSFFFWLLIISVPVFKYLGQFTISWRTFLIFASIYTSADIPSFLSYQRSVQQPSECFFSSSVI